MVHFWYILLLMAMLGMDGCGAYDGGSSASEARASSCRCDLDSWQPDPVDLILAPGWSSDHLEAFVDPFGTVHISGIATVVAQNSESPQLRLPDGMFPGRTIHLPFVAEYELFTIVRQIRIETDGAIYLSEPSVNAPFEPGQTFYLDGLSFTVAQ